ncbi:DUF423 domain-containing protein [Nostoc sp. GT001]|uniref:DUF423 domain-containing protein n=1 Tax=Nostoc sp. GT001 TaxID=3056647 RepID=UPI0025AB3E86|nr:DUF423 domain-containing protein [Nostoc sp. GT001]MDM9584505.1 DUF423 domain-containing protein [Nostoc sp. GT001]
MTQIFLSVAAILGGLSVAAGAFASHTLREKISERCLRRATPTLEIFETGARYQMYHALALFLVAILMSRTESPQPSLVASGWLFIIGIAIFSGSLYALSLTGIKSLGAMSTTGYAYAPLGGTAFLAAWGTLAFAAWNLKL